LSFFGTVDAVLWLLELIDWVADRLCAWVVKWHLSCIFHQRTGRGCSLLLTSCSFTYSCKTILNEHGLTH